VNLRGDNSEGWTLLELAIIVAIIAILTTIAVASYVVASSTSLRVTCEYNRASLGHALEQYNNEHASTASDILDLGPFVQSARSLHCPDEGSYTLNASGDTVYCSQHP